MEVMCTKHQEPCPLSTASLDSYLVQPTELVPFNVIKDTMMEVVGNIYGGDRMGGTDLVSLQHWILIFGAESRDMRLAVADLTEWLANQRPPWASYHALITGRLITLDKQLGSRPVKVGETWLRLMAKCVLRVNGDRC